MSGPHIARASLSAASMPLAPQTFAPPPAPVDATKKNEAPRSQSVGRSARISFMDDDDDDDDFFVDPRSRRTRSRIPAPPLKTRAWSPRRYETRTKQMRAR